MEKVEVFRSGRHTDNARETREWTPDTVREIARRYNESQYSRLRAPATKGHPSTTGEPAYGWIKRFDTVESDDGVVVLTADFEDIDDGFFEEVRKGRYVNRSLCVHPVTLEVDHLAWLGASQPAVDGMQRPLVYAAANDAGTVTIDIPAAHAAATDGQPPANPDTSTQASDMTPEQLQQILDAMTAGFKEITDKLDKIAPADAKADTASGDTTGGDSGAGSGAQFSRATAEEEKEFEEFRFGKILDATPGLDGKITPANRPGILRQMARFSKLEGKVSFSRPTADGKGTETAEGSELDAYLADLPVTLPKMFSSGTQATKPAGEPQATASQLEADMIAAKAHRNGK